MQATLYLMVVCLATLAGCASTSVPGKVYRGKYFYNFETAAFTPEGSSEPWCVDSALIKGAEIPSDNASGRSGGTADIVVRGKLSAGGSYCNLGAYKRFLEITEVLGISNRRSTAP